jgi:hypothetical protein
MSPARQRSLRGSLAALPLLACLALAATPAAADEYDARRAGHPLRVVAYVLHPVGVALDYLLFRPAHWVGSQPVVRTIFGHDVDEQPQR